MIRLLPIALFGCLAIACAFLIVTGMEMHEQFGRLSADPTEISCEDLLSARYSEPVHLSVTDFKPGRHVIPVRDTDSANKRWQSAYAVLFPVDLRGLESAYAGAVIHLADVHNDEELEQVLKQDSVDCYFWPAKQELPPRIHSNLALKYRSMDLSRNRRVEAGEPVGGEQLAIGLWWTGVIGLGLGVFSLVSFYLFKIVSAIRQRGNDDFMDSTTDINPEQNRAGLPAIDA